MNKSLSRTENSMRNATVSLICHVATTLISFISRTIFIRILGSDYLGISGLFTNILSVLSLADLGISTAISYSLYKPIADNDHDKVAAIIGYFGRIYTGVALFILGAGIALTPFLDKLISSEIAISNVTLYYLVYLLETASSYLFVYKSIILGADQKQYIVKVQRTIVLLMTNVLKLLSLYLFHSFFIYLIIQVLGEIITNIILSIRAEKEYPYIKKRVLLPREYKKKILDNVRSLFLYKLGYVILYHTDNILISLFASTTVVGYYSNYGLLFGTITTLSELIFGGMSASIGNKIVTSDKDSIYETFKIINFANFWVYGFCSVCLFCLMDDFVYIWIGSRYVLGAKTSFIISLNVFIPGMLSAVASFRNATGLFKQTKYVYFLTAMLNLVLSIVLGKKWGLNGIILATGISRLLTNAWYEPYLLISKYLGKDYINYLKRSCVYYMLFILPCVLAYVVKLYGPNITITFFVSEMVICVVGVNILYYILFYKTDEYNELMVRMKHLLQKYNLNFKVQR